VPEGVDETAIRTRLLNEFDLEIGAGLGDMAGKIWRIGLMGYSAKQENVDTWLNTLKNSL
jgi:alanine-glyoxylate transaminase/serine-glyoxylate transaminase/serine-pyruvate transaminase